MESPRMWSRKSFEAVDEDEEQELVTALHAGGVDMYRGWWRDSGSSFGKALLGGFDGVRQRHAFRRVVDDNGILQR